MTVGMESRRKKEVRDEEGGARRLREKKTPRSQRLANAETDSVGPDENKNPNPKNKKKKQHTKKKKTTQPKNQTPTQKNTPHDGTPSTVECGKRGGVEKSLWGASN